MIIVKRCTYLHHIVHCKLSVKSIIPEMRIFSLVTNSRPKKMAFSFLNGNKMDTDLVIIIHMQDSMHVYCAF